MDKIHFFSAGGGSSSDVGVSSGTADLFLLLDGTRSVSGAINSETESTYGFGGWDKAFGSGYFQNVVLSGFKMREDNSDLLISHTDGRTASARARIWYTSTSGIAITGARLQGTSGASLTWRASGGTINSAYDTNISKGPAGCIQIGTTSNNRQGTLEAASGVFRTQIVFAAPNGSGWKVTVDNNGNLATTGPFVLE